MKNQKMKFAAMNLPQILRTPRWLEMMILLPLLMMMIHFAMAAPAAVPVVPVETPVVEKFDHVKTGFNLTGAHATARCTACHINNVFKGTPKDCALCHAAGNKMSATPKSTTHIPTNIQCDVCHKTTLWKPAFFSHVGVTDGACGSCHNGEATKGKSNSHIATSADCAACHSTVSFVALKAGAVMPLPSGHFLTNQSCSVCHNSAAFIPGVMNHIGTSGQCDTCHKDGVGYTIANAVNPPVMPYTKTYHPSSNMSSHMDTSKQCDACHTSTTNWVFSPNSTNMPAGHLPSTMPCATCHTSGYGPSSGVMNHAGILTGCAGCHNGQGYMGGPFKPMPGNHIKTGAACELCHDTASTSTGGFALNVTMKHAGISSGCASCHGGTQTFVGSGLMSNPVSKPTGTPPHITTSQPCELCHKPTRTGIGEFLLLNPKSDMNHTGIAGGCATCHDGQTFAVNMTPKNKSAYTDPNGNPHLSTALDCSSCHFSTVLFSGAVANLPANHIPTTQTCTLCHANGTGTNSGVMNHAGIVNNCSACHDGTKTFVGSPPQGGKPKNTSAYINHIPLQGRDCSVCHMPSTFAAGGFAGGNGGTTLPAGHLTTTLPCSTCHANGYSSSLTVMSHTGIASGCANCHNGQTFTVNTTPVNKSSYPSHMTTTQDCKDCHMPSTFATGGFANGTGGTTLPSGHLPTVMPCSTCHTSYGANSGVMSHVGIASGCANCHNGQTFYLNMKPVNKSNFPTHIGTSLDCSSCHSISNFISFAGATGGGMPSNHIQTSQPCTLCHAAGYSLSLTVMNHTGIATSACLNCHNGQSFAGPQTPKKYPSNHIPYSGNLLGGSTMTCSFCHTSTNAGGFGTGMLVSSTTMHNNSKGNGTDGFCKTCHASGTSYLGVLGSKKSVTHQKSGATDCVNSGCHNVQYTKNW